jgi:hypothetical protein
MMLLRSFAISVLLFLSGCATNVPLTAPVSASSEAAKLSFLDIAKFDRDLATALTGQPSAIEVVFYDKVSPNNVPERLQKWMSVIEADGGKILVEPPPNELVSRSPFAALSLIGTLVSSIQKIAQFRSEQIYDSAKGRNAVISLERNSKGEVLVSNIKFIKRSP